ncbi:transcriptional regulator CynR [Streptomyces lunalinharesii]|uniref:Transcriptional regulator CynR n=1 Tax=Streptomyces lunalinharesii TaxID=333384 RepID=A0ABN3RIA5_9ACTN
MALELRHLRSLLAVAEHGSFTRAAEALHLSQPALSQQIGQLERTVGAQLLDRSGRTVRPTDAGTVFLRHARSALTELDAGTRAVLDVQDLAHGRLRLAHTPTFSTYLIGPLVQHFRACWPGITLDVRETTQDAIEAGLLADELDLGLAFRGDQLPGITGETLFVERLGIVVGIDHPLAGRPDPVGMRDLGPYQLALFTGGFTTRARIDAHFAGHGIRPPHAVETNSLTALVDVVRRTTLVTVLPDRVTREHPELCTVPLDPALPARTAVLLRRAAAHESAAARVFGRLVRDRCGAP